MKVIDAMEMGKNSILSVIDELRTHTVEHWNEMIADVELNGEATVDQRAISTINSDNFEDPKAHRLASMLCLFRYLNKFAIDQGDELMFKVSVRQVVGEGQDLEELLDKVMPHVMKKVKSQRKDVW